MTAEEYFHNHWQEANRSRFGDYGDYDSDEYAIAFANDYAALADAIKSVCEHQWMNSGLTLQGKSLKVCLKCRHTEQTVC